MRQQKVIESKLRSAREGECGEKIMIIIVM